VQSLVSKLKTQKGITIEHKVMQGANHFFQDRIDELVKICGDYVDRRLAKDLQAV
jgi:alpha/beta superfamily hydrolase